MRSPLAPAGGVNSSFTSSLESGDTMTALISLLPPLSAHFQSLGTPETSRLARCGGKLALRNVSGIESVSPGRMESSGWGVVSQKPVSSAAIAARLLEKGETAMTAQAAAASSQRSDLLIVCSIRCRASGRRWELHPHRTERPDAMARNYSQLRPR